MDIAGRGKPNAASQLSAEVTNNVAEQVAAHDDIKLPGISHHLHGQRVDVKVAGVDLWILLPDLLEHPLPEVVSKGHGVGFVAHANPFQAVAAGVIESVTDNPLHAFARIDIFLYGDL